MVKKYDEAQTIARKIGIKKKNKETKEKKLLFFSGNKNTIKDQKKGLINGEELKSMALNR